VQIPVVASTTTSIPSGITPAELTLRVAELAPYRPLSASVLTGWLLSNGLAVERDGLLYPTERGLEVGGVLAIE
jgi:hypothetical protein